MGHKYGPPCIIIGIVGLFVPKSMLTFCVKLDILCSWNLKNNPYASRNRIIVQDGEEARKGEVEFHLLASDLLCQCHENGMAWRYAHYIGP